MKRGNIQIGRKKGDQAKTRCWMRKFFTVKTVRSRWVAWYGQDLRTARLRGEP